MFLIYLKNTNPVGLSHLKQTACDASSQTQTQRRCVSLQDGTQLETPGGLYIRWDLTKRRKVHLCSLIFLEMLH